MRQQSASGTPVVVSLPAEIDMTNAGQVYDRLTAAAAGGAPVVIADCTAMIFCDAAGVRRLVMCHAGAAAHGVQLRLVIAPGGLLRRLLELLGADSVLPVYASVEEASVLPVQPVRDPLSLALDGPMGRDSPGAWRRSRRQQFERPHQPLSVTGVRPSVLVWDSLG